MRIAPCSLCLALAAFLALPASAPEAAPLDAKVGQVRAVYRKAGTVLRGQPAALAPATATLPSGTAVRIEEIKLPWMRVTALGSPGGTGWLKALETVERNALTPHTAPVQLSGGKRVNSRDVTAAGRQLDAGTERGYRRSRANLHAAYQAVDRMEAATRALVPADSIEFIVQGRLGRRGRDFARPPLLPPSPRAAATGRTRAPRQRRSGGGIGGLLGGLGDKIGGDIGKVLRSKEGRAAGKFFEGLAEQKRQLAERFTPEQEYYLGRAVAAYAIAKYGIDPDPNRRAYVRQVGDAVVRLSRRVPANFGGYHFDVLNSDEINGVSGPGGFVLLTRGAVRACQSEAELAGLICHELAHVTQKHGESVLRQGKSFKPFLEGLTSAAGTLAGVEGVGQRLVQFFGKVVGEMSRTAVETGYGRNLEFAADAEGTHLLFDVYYERDALQTFLARMPAHQHGHAGTHAAPQVRAQALQGVIARYTQFTVGAAEIELRRQRFQARTGVVATPR